MTNQNHSVTLFDNIMDNTDNTITIDISDISTASTIDLSFNDDMGSICIYDTAASTISPYTSVTGSSFSASLGPSYEELIARLEHVENIIVEEAKIRQHQPAVKQAYDEYKLLLELAKFNNVLTDE